MSTRSQREFLTAQLASTRQMLDLLGDHPFMSIGMKEKEQELQAEIAKLPDSEQEARVILYFSGDAVEGSQGIDARFVGNVLPPFQNMVMSEYADRWHGSVGKRGRFYGETESRLLLTALPRGSFGLELTCAECEDFFTEDQLAESLGDVSKLIEISAQSDEQFEAQINNSDPRVIQNLKLFLEVIAHADAGLEVETGTLHSKLSPPQAQAAYQRVSRIITDEEEIVVDGYNKGILLGDWRFNFQEFSGFVIKGKLENSISEQTAAEYNRLTNERCKAHLLKTTITFKNNKSKTSYVLKSLTPLQEQ